MIDQTSNYDAHELYWKNCIRVVEVIEYLGFSKKGQSLYDKKILKVRFYTNF